MKDANELLVAAGPEVFLKRWTEARAEASKTLTVKAKAPGRRSAPASVAKAPASPAEAITQSEEAPVSALPAGLPTPEAPSLARTTPEAPAPVRTTPRPVPPEEPEPAAKEENTHGTAPGGQEHIEPPAFVLDETRTYVLTCGLRSWRVRGLSAFGVDRMRVNLRVDQGARFHVDTIDLYSARSRQSFIEGALSALRLDESDGIAIGEEITLVITALEKERLSLRQQGASEAKAPVMSAADREEALAFLRSANLVDLIAADFDAVGCVGEKEALLTGFLALISRLLPKPLSILFCARSGAGKSTLQDALCDFVPPEDLVKYTRISGQVLFYKDENALVRKVLAVEEEEGANQAAYALRSLLSNGYLSCSVTRTDPKTGRQVDDDRKVNGPTAVLLTSAHPETLDYETRNRFVLLTVDESREQTERILTRQLFGETLEGLLAGERKKAILNRHQNAQRLLQPLRVVIPFAVSFPRGYLILRREQRKYLTLLESIALLFQHQRPKKTVQAGGVAVEYIEVTEGDVEIARPLALLILARNLDELAPPARSLYIAMRGLSREKKATLEKAPEVPRKPGAARRYLLGSGENERDERLCLERREIQKGTGLSLWHIKTYMPQLIEYGYVAQLSGSKGKTCLYEVLDVEEPEEPRL